jgi:uncharacterized peroxidase-related enzyme
MSGVPLSDESGAARTAVALNLPVVEEEAATGEVRDLYEQFRARFGRPDIPGIVKCFATHPPLLRGMLQIAEGLLFVDGSLTRRHKEMIATLLSSQNQCPYCANSHGAFLLAQGGSAELLSALRAGSTAAPSLTPPEQALLHFAAKINAGSQSVTRADVEETMRAGWTEAQIVETVHLAALFAAFNRIANGFGLS